MNELFDKWLRHKLSFSMPLKFIQWTVAVVKLSGEKNRLFYNARRNKRQQTNSNNWRQHTQIEENGKVHHEINYYVWILNDCTYMSSFHVLYICCCCFLTEWIVLADVCNARAQISTCKQLMDQIISLKLYFKWSIWKRAINYISFISNRRYKILLAVSSRFCNCTQQ